MTLSMGISFLVTTGISALASWIDKLIVTKEEMKEAAEEAKSAIDDIKSEFDSLSSSTDNIKKRFAELAQGVKNLGKANQSRGRLSTEDYNEFLDLSNQLSDLFPQLTKGYDDNGNAILDLSGNVNTIVGSLDNLVSVQQKLANQEILGNMGGVWAGYTVDLEKYKEELEYAETMSAAAIEAIENLNSKKFEIKSKPSEDNVDDVIIDELKNMGYDFLDYRKVAFADYVDHVAQTKISTWDFSSLDDTEFEKIKNAIASAGSEYEDTVQLTKSKIASANSEMSSYINTWLLWSSIFVTLQPNFCYGVYATP